MKDPLIPGGFEPATFRFVAQHLNHCATAVPWGPRRFITALTSVRRMSLSWVSPIQPTYPHPTSWRSVLILSTHLRLGLPSGLFPSGFPTKTIYTPLSSPIPRMWSAIHYFGITKSGSRSQWLRDLRRQSGSARFVGLGVWIPLSLICEFCVCCCPVEVPASVLSLVQRSPTKCVVSNWVWLWKVDDKEALAHQGCCTAGGKIVCVTDSVVSQVTNKIKHVVRGENKVVTEKLHVIFHSAEKRVVLGLKKKALLRNADVRRQTSFVTMWGSGKEDLE